MAHLRRILLLLLAAAVSLGAGLGVTWLVDRMPCHGERLACNIDAAVGGYATIIWAALGLLIFGIIVLFMRRRLVLAIAAVVLVVPLLLFVGADQIEGWRYVGVYPYSNFRSFLAIFAPPAATVLVQYLILRLVAPARLPAAAA